MAPEKKSMARPATKEEYATLRELFRPHIESFDYFLDKGLDKMLESIRPMEITDPNSNKFLRNILHASALLYFICGGMERLIRILILQKRNYPMSLVRGSFVNRGAGYTDKAVVIRCVQDDQSSVTIKLYYLQNGSARLGFWLGGREFLLPVGIVLKVAKAVLKDYVFVHLKYNHDKFNLLIFMLQKLYALVDKTAAPDNADALQYQEALLPGHLITVFLKDRLQDWLRKTKRLILEEAAKNKSFDLHDAHEIRKFLGKNTTSVGRAIESMLKVGKVNSQSGLDLPQRDGMTIQAERLNFHRYISHFRAVHRGAAFAKMRTTSIPEDLEVGYVPLSLGGAYPGLYLFTNPARFVRPVRNLISLPDGKENIELIGPFEQAFMEIKCPDGGAGGRNILFPATHEEIHPTAILSVVANLTPWSDHNQSPRNMYQCQMAKQTMGFCGQALKFRTDVKAFHLQVCFV
ncbi:hypothetical protein PR202_gb00571 [Eleusine coracana subsp. coracana]|uniref:DNA-directed RNA polymerase n=1 Tax=Eleusine coracana subsp. coracana TaxID=191504 RepID=A0AAV5DSX3_ELECO|nr:hypothetical protein PR202_gb00571 [Eleusine coracana subsp. coracana]